MADDDAFDYLGRRTPLNPRRVGLNTGAGGGPSIGGGAAVTSAPTPSVTARTGAAREILSNSGVGLPQILGDVRGGLSAAEKINDLFPSSSARGETISSAPPSGAAGAVNALIDPSRDFLGSAAGPTSFGDIDPALLSQFPGGGATVGAAPLEELGALQGVAEAIGLSVGEAIPFVGAAIGAVEAATAGRDPAATALDTAAVAAAPFTYGVSLLAIPIIEALMGGSPELSHKQREEISTGKILQGAGTEAGALKNAKTLPDLWKAVVAMQSGSVGGTDDPATVMNLPLKSNQLQAAIDAGAVSLPTRYGKDASRYLQEHPGETLNIFPGNENATYPVWTQQGFFNALRQNPRGLKAVIQGGVAPENLAQGDQALSNTLLRAFQRLQVPPPETAMPAMPPPPPVNVGGPSEALGFTQDVVQNAS